MLKSAAFAADFGTGDADDSRDLQSYVADMREHADTICEQLQDEIAKERQVLRSSSLLAFLQDEVAKQDQFATAADEARVNANASIPLTLAPRFAEPVVLRDAKRFAALVKVAEAEKESSDVYWKDWAGSIERTCKARYAKAEEEAAKALQRAKDAEDRALSAEMRAAMLESSSLPRGGGMEQRELNLDELLLLTRRLGVRITFGAPASKDSELDSLVAELANREEASGNKRDSSAQAPKSLMGAQPLPLLPAAQLPTFEQMLQTVRTEMQGLLTKLANQHAWEMSNIASIPNEASKRSGGLYVEPSEDDKAAVLQLPELQELRASAFAGDLPGQVPELEVKTETEGSPGTALEQAKGTKLWEPVLCSAWRNLPGLEKAPQDDEIAMVGRAPGGRASQPSNRLVIRESSRQRLVWDSLSVVFAAYDAVITPLHVLGLPNNAAFNGMMWVKPVFWLLDIVLSFISGYVHDGVDEVLLKKIAWRYLFTFLPLDVFLLVLELCTLLLLSHGTFKMVEYDGRRLHGTHIDESVQDERALFAVRCLLSLHLLKVHGNMGKRIAWRIHSQSLRIKLGIAHIVALILLCCHIAACGFYAIGVIEDDQDNSWVEKNLVGKPLGVKYILSLQWSLAQFTVGTTGAHAGSFAEGAYSASIDLVAAFMLMLLFARVVGAVLQLSSTAHGKRQQQLSKLMEYLVQCQVPAPLRSRVWNTAAQRAAKVVTSGSRVHEQEVPILACLPQGLQSELHAAVYSPTLTAHPLFRELELGLGVSSPAGGQAVRAVHAALSELVVRADHVLFSTGEVAKNMYFVAQGDLNYRMASKAPTDVELLAASAERTGLWFSEPALWINWEHCGEMTAVVQSELFALEAKRLQDLMKQEPLGAMLCGRYARAFASYAKQCQLEITDTYINMDALENITSSVLEGLWNAGERHVSFAIADPGAFARSRADLPNQLAASESGGDLPNPIAAPELAATSDDSKESAPAEEKPRPSYIGMFTHPTFGHSEIPMEVTLVSSSEGCWTAEGQTEQITVQRDGANILLAELSGTTQLDGQEVEGGMLIGAVIQAGVRDGMFRLEPCQGNSTALTGTVH